MNNHLHIPVIGSSIHLHVDLRPNSNMERITGQWSPKVGILIEAHLNSVVTGTRYMVCCSVVGVVMKVTSGCLITTHVTLYFYSPVISAYYERIVSVMDGVH